MHQDDVSFQWLFKASVIFFKYGELMHTCNQSHIDLITNVCYFDTIFTDIIYTYISHFIQQYYLIQQTQMLYKKISLFCDYRHCVWPDLASLSFVVLWILSLSPESARTQNSLTEIISVGKYTGFTDLLSNSTVHCYQGIFVIYFCSQAKQTVTKN